MVTVMILKRDIGEATWEMDDRDVEQTSHLFCLEGRDKVEEIKNKLLRGEIVVAKYCEYKMT
jgi:hypothetical protein